jgi:tricarboxylate carrier
MGERIDVDAPLWDQTSFYGRFRHFAWMSNPLNGLKSSTQLEEAKTLVVAYKNGQEPEGTTQEQVTKAMQLYKSAFHPDTGELQNIFGRMSFQLPGGMLITGAMLQFYKTVPAVVFWQWFNQSFNALVNYTNRNANSSTTTTELGIAYTSATFSALTTAIGLRKLCEKSTNTLIQRFVPFAAVAAANCVNIPLMRQNEIINGITLYDSDGKLATNSKKAAQIGISQVVFSRVTMAAPGMLVLPLIMLHSRSWEWVVSCLLWFPWPVLSSPRRLR